MWAVRKFDLPGACVGLSYLLTSAGHNLAASGTACSGDMGYTARATRRLVKCFGRDSCSLACCAPLAASFCCAGSRKGAARVLPLSLGAAPDLCRRGVDEIALNIGEGSGYHEHQEPGTDAIVGPRGLGVWDALYDPEQAKVLRARRPIRVTVVTSPEAALRSIRLGSRRSARAPVFFRQRLLPLHPAARLCCSCALTPRAALGFS